MLISAEGRKSVWFVVPLLVNFRGAGVAGRGSQRLEMLGEGW